MTKILLYVVASIAVVLVVVFVAGSNVPNTPAQPVPGLTAKPAPSAPQAAENSLGGLPDLSLQDYSGKTVRLSDFRGRPVVVNAWASWCPFCRQELPDFAAAQKEFSARGGPASGGGEAVVIIAIDRGESLSTAKGYTDKQGTTNSLIFLLDPSDSFYQSIGGFSMPETIFVKTAISLTTSAARWT